LDNDAQITQTCTMATVNEDTVAVVPPMCTKAGTRPMARVAVVPPMCTKAGTRPMARVDHSHVPKGRHNGPWRRQ
jgi:hypothetical protein